MILDKLDNLTLYGNIVPDAQRILAHVNAPETRSLPAGRYDVPGTGAYILVQHLTTEPAEQRRFESHQRYMDIQIVLSGSEIMQWAELSALAPSGDYSPEKDVRLYQNPDSCADIRVEAGQFALFLPEDGHKPLCADGQPGAVSKIVVKVPV